MEKSRRKIIKNIYEGALWETYKKITGWRSVVKV